MQDLLDSQKLHSVMKDSQGARCLVHRATLDGW